jgi:hypothetical protein
MMRIRSRSTLLYLLEIYSFGIVTLDDGCVAEEEHTYLDPPDSQRFWCFLLLLCVYYARHLHLVDKPRK